MKDKNIAEVVVKSARGEESL